MAFFGLTCFKDFVQILITSEKNAFGSNKKSEISWKVLAFIWNPIIKYAITIIRILCIRRYTMFLSLVNKEKIWNIILLRRKKRLITIQ